MQKRASKSTGGIYRVSFKIKTIKRVERGEGVIGLELNIIGSHLLLRPCCIYSTLTECFRSAPAATSSS